MHGQLPEGPLVLAFCHGDQLALVAARQLVSSRGLTVPVSLSRDGRLQVQIMQRLGIATVDGSSSRGGAMAARGLLRVLRRGDVVAVAVDGPRGPRRVAKEGVARLSAWARCPVVPITMEGRGHHMKTSWDAFFLPYPFSAICVRIGASISADAGEDTSVFTGRVTDALRESGTPHHP
ncbi:MAG: DUF374 domain-containing protein [Bradymonadia bacterium]